MICAPPVLDRSHSTVPRRYPLRTMPSIWVTVISVGWLFQTLPSGRSELRCCERMRLPAFLALMTSFRARGAGRARADAE